MTVRVGIYGFGGIGRQSLRALIERTPDAEVVAVNDLVDAKMNGLLFKHDSTYGAYPGSVAHTDDALIVDAREIVRLPRRKPLVDHRLLDDDGDRRNAGQDHRLVRQ